MSSIVLPVDPNRPDPEAITRAARVLREGGLVAFPTETVYGLGAHALDRAAVARIFAAKGRPASNPVIVHVPGVAEAKELVSAWPEAAEALAKRFWPGPLSLVLPKHARVPDIVTGGAATVAVRVPAHPVALALLRAAGVPVAAPSANRSNYVSPTCAAHVLAGLQDRIDVILDGGPCPGGLESTVVDLTTTPARLLRPGLVSPAALEEVLGPMTRSLPSDAPGAPLPSPGLLARHYAPRALLEVTDSGRERAEALQHLGVRVGRVTFREAPSAGRTLTLELPQDAAGYAAQLYAALYTLDTAGIEHIVVDRPPESEEWLAIHDRLRRAAQGGPSPPPLSGTP